jgi:hypothetical protein
MTAYNNPATSGEKAEALRNERRLRRGEREPSTYHKLAGLADDLGGRFAVEAGQSKSTDYPMQPASSPWSGAGADPGLEAPLGYSVNDLEPTGEAHEQALSELAQEGQRCVPHNAGEDNAAHLVEAVALTADANAVVKSQVDNSPACAETASTKSTAEEPDDGLDTSRREDGWPLSSPPIKRRRLSTNSEEA